MAWQRQSQTECLFGETNKELRKYKYGIVRSRNHNMTHCNMFNACVGSRLLEHEPSQTLQNAVMRRCHPPFFFIPLPPKDTEPYMRAHDGPQHTTETLVLQSYYMCLTFA